MAEQNERNYLKQKRPPPEAKLIKIKGDRRTGRKKAKKYDKTLNWYRDVGFGFETPEEAKKGKYVDKKCPFTGNIKIRGRILSGIVKSAKMNKTVIVRRDYLHFIKKYQRYEKRHKNIPAHLSPCFRVKEGDRVTIGECRPLSKTVRYNVIKIFSKHLKDKGKKFSGF